MPHQDPSDEAELSVRPAEETPFEQATPPPRHGWVRVIVTGSRNWTNETAVRQVLDRLLAQHHHLVVMEGGCPTGADRQSKLWAVGQPLSRVALLTFEADWAKRGNAAGPRRNEEMVGAGADMVLVFANPCRKRKPWCPKNEHPSHGTENCVQEARKANIPVFFCPAGMRW